MLPRLLLVYNHLGRWEIDGKEVKDVFRRPGARVEVGSAR